jgi:outer membrane protein insertion porin family
MINKKIISAVAVWASLFYLLAPGAFPQGPTDEERVVTAVKIEGNKSISGETVLSKVKTKAGDKFSQDVINEDIKRLYGTEFFTDVSVDVKDKSPGQAAVTFIVKEKPVIDDIVFKGNTAFRAQKLKSTMKSKPNEMLNLVLLTQDMSDLRSLYIKKGYPQVEIKYELDIDKETNKARVTVIINEKTRVRVEKIDIKGNKAIKTADIRKVMGTKTAWLFSTGNFNEDTFQEDMEKIKSMYDDKGYLDAVIEPELDYSQDGTELSITLDITEGKQYKIGDMTIKGNLVLPEKDVRSKISMRPGKPFSNRQLRVDVVSVRQFYYRYGYMNVAVEVDKQLNASTGDIDIIYDIDAREPVYVGKIEIRGNIRTKDVVVRRELRVYPGDRFNGDKIIRSKERIYNLGFFENVSFDTEPTDTPDVQNLVVTVKETKTGEFSFGGGYSSVDMLIGFVEITQRNFDILNWPYFTGAGQYLAIKAELGMVRNNFNISWTDPWILGWPFSFGFDAYNTSHNKSGDVGWAYDEMRTGGDLKLGKNLTDELRADLVYRLERIKISNIDDNSSQDLKDESGSNNVSSLLLDMTYDSRDNVFNPGRGWIVNGSIENAGGIILGDKNYIKGTAGVSFYYTFFERFVLELKGRAGMESAYGKSDSVPIYERFFAGGINTIRGYKERRVGPRDPGSNEPIGGDSIFLANAELTFPLYENMLKGAVFYDIGNVWQRSGDFIRGGNFKAGTGVGVRVKTPLGPVRVDWGYPLNSNYDDERTGEFYFSMSRGF